jgi:hypothetical protein
MTYHKHGRERKKRGKKLVGCGLPFSFPFPILDLRSEPPVDSKQMFAIFLAWATHKIKYGRERKEELREPLVLDLISKR